MSIFRYYEYVKHANINIASNSWQIMQGREVARQKCQPK